MQVTVGVDLGGWEGVGVSGVQTREERKSGLLQAVQPINVLEPGQGAQGHSGTEGRGKSDQSGRLSQQQLRPRRPGSLAV